MRKILAAGNWKMNNTPSQAEAMINELKGKVAGCKNDVLNRRTRQRTSGYAKSKTRHQRRRDFDIVRKLKYKCCLQKSKNH